MPPVDEYRRNAVECLRLVAELTDPQNKALMIEMANAWMRLAELAVKNSKTDIVFEVLKSPARGASRSDAKEPQRPGPRKTEP